MRTVYIGLDDTDNLESRGTGHLARLIATELSHDHRLLGVTRHQLSDDPRVPRTAKNSCAAIALRVNNGVSDDELIDRVGRLMLDHFQPGSDPGLCLLAIDGTPAGSEVAATILAFGRRAQTQLVSQDQAWHLASSLAVPLLGLGGTEDGVIGALAATGLAACGDDGRYVMVGRSRELAGLQPVSVLLDAGISAVRTLDGCPIESGLVQSDKLRPARRGGLPIAVVESGEGFWLPLKLD